MDEYGPSSEPAVYSARFGNAPTEVAYTVPTAAAAGHLAYPNATIRTDDPRLGSAKLNSHPQLRLASAESGTISSKKFALGIMPLEISQLLRPIPLTYCLTSSQPNASGRRAKLRGRGRVDGRGT